MRATLQIREAVIWRPDSPADVDGKCSRASLCASVCVCVGVCSLRLCHSNRVAHKCEQIRVRMPALRAPASVLRLAWTEVVTQSIRAAAPVPRAARYRGDNATNGTQHFMEVWLFNITNVEEIRNGAKPKLVRAAHACHMLAWTCTGSALIRTQNDVRDGNE